MMFCAKLFPEMSNSVIVSGNQNILSYHTTLQGSSLPFAARNSRVKGGFFSRLERVQIVVTTRVHR